MYTNATTPLENLIMKLKLIDDDIILLNRIKKPFDLSTYGNVGRIVEETLFTQNKGWDIPNCERVEKAGFLLFKNTDGIIAFLSRKGNLINVPLSA